MKKIIFVMIVLVCYSCDNNAKYISKTIDIMEKHSIKKDSIDWNKMRIESKEKIRKNDSKENAYTIIRNNLYQLQDNHSQFMTETSYKKITDEKLNFNKIEYELIEEEIFYIRIPTFTNGGDKQIKYANYIKEVIESIDSSKNINKWIIDLTNNLGGNMWPMYLGLSPILKSGVSGYFVDSKGEFTEWKYEKNAVYQGPLEILRFDNSYEINSNNSKIAVLINSKTASSGEAVGVMFKNFPNTKFFGEESWGASSGNQTFNLNDGAKLILTTSIFADRTKKLYGKKLKPDYYCRNPKEKAIDWMKE